MGWTCTPGASKKDIIADRCRTQQWANGATQYRLETVKRRIIGNCLWAIRERYINDELDVRYIALDLLGSDGDGWCYKDLSESVGPAEVNCPLSYLEEVDMPEGESAANWREAVRAYHEKGKAARELVNSLKPGDEFEIEGGKPSRFVMQEKVGRSLFAIAMGVRYKIAPRHFQRIKLIPD